MNTKNFARLVSFLVLVAAVSFIGVSAVSALTAELYEERESAYSGVRDGEKLLRTNFAAALEDEVKSFGDGYIIVETMKNISHLLPKKRRAHFRSFELATMEESVCGKPTVTYIADSRGSFVISVEATVDAMPYLLEPLLRIVGENTDYEFSQKVLYDRILRIKKILSSGKKECLNFLET